MNRDDLAWWLELAPTMSWRFAKSMADTPHSYVVKDNQLGEKDFERAVRVIRTFGIPGKFYSRTNVYLISPSNGHRWWTMGAGADETTIINQAPWDQTYGKQNAPSTESKHWSVYDEIAVDYDARYVSPKDQAEEKQVMSLLKTTLGPMAPTLLDIGCGTGLLLDHRITHPSLFTGVDPSQAMLNELVRKHTDATDLYPQTWAEFMADRMRGSYATFDLVTILFGSASYLSPAELMSALDMSHRAFVAMHYLPGYLPDYHHDKPAHVDTSREWSADLPGARVFELGNFQVTVVTK